MKSLKYTVFLLLFACVLSNATFVNAQTGGDRVLVAGKNSLRQSDINGLIEFYEWAFETEFSSDQRERFQELVLEAFRNDAAASRKNTDVVLNVYRQVKNLDAETQQQKREMFVSDFVGELRKTPDDETSKFMLEIYGQSQGQNQSSDVANDSNTNNADDTNISNVSGVSDLAGTWVWGSSGSMTKTTTGVYLGGTASRFTYRFFANGTVQYTGIMTVMTGGCRLQAFTTKKGRVSINGDTMTIVFSPASFSRDDTCSPAKNYKKTLPAETEVYKIKFKNDYGQTQLCMTGKDETCFSKQ